jgi:hypothetical protein
MFQKRIDECSHNMKVELRKDGESQFQKVELRSGILIRPLKNKPNTTSCMKLRKIFPCNVNTFIVRESKSVKLLSMNDLKEHEKLHFANFFYSLYLTYFMISVCPSILVFFVCCTTIKKH